MVDLSDEEVTAAIDLVGRTGARQLQVGYLYDDVPTADADWYAHAQYRGARIQVEHHTSPQAAILALARRLLTGACCAHCGGLVQIHPAGAAFYRDAFLVDGSRFTGEQAQAKQCRWRRIGEKWVQGCSVGDVDGQGK